MSFAGRLKYQVSEFIDRRRYGRWLSNGDEVREQNRLAASGSHRSIISALDFHRGHTFVIRDGLSAAHTFSEIFLCDHYPAKMLAGAETIVDVGANIGLLSFYARLQNPSARIISFEADPSTFTCLQANTATLNIECHNNAIASGPGVLDFFCSDISGWSSAFPVLGAARGTKVTVPAVRLSDFIAEQQISSIDFLKVDVEGAEYDILLGDGGLWNLPVKTLVVEADRNPRDERYTFADLTTLLKKHFRSVLETKGGNYPLLVCH